MACQCAIRQELRRDFSQKLRRFKDGQPHDARVATFDALDEQSRKPLNGIAAGFVVWFIRTNIGFDLLGRES